MSILVDVMDMAFWISGAKERWKRQCYDLALGMLLSQPQNVSHLLDAYFQGGWTANYCKLMDVRMLQDPVA